MKLPVIMVVLESFPYRSSNSAAAEVNISFAGHFGVSHSKAQKSQAFRKETRRAALMLAHVSARIGGLRHLAGYTLGFSTAYFEIARHTDRWQAKSCRRP